MIPGRAPSGARRVTAVIRCASASGARATSVERGAVVSWQARGAERIGLVLIARCRPRARSSDSGPGRKRGLRIAGSRAGRRKGQRGERHAWTHVQRTARRVAHRVDVRADDSGAKRQRRACAASVARVGRAGRVQSGETWAGGYTGAGLATATRTSVRMADGRAGSVNNASVPAARVDGSSPASIARFRPRDVTKRAK